MAREKVQTSAREFIDRFNSLGIPDDDGQPVTVTKGTVSKLVNDKGMPLVGAAFSATMRWLADSVDPNKPKSKLGAAAARWLAGQGRTAPPTAPKSGPATNPCPPAPAPTRPAGARHPKPAAPPGPPPPAGSAPGSLAGVKLLFPDGTTVPLEDVPPERASRAVERFWISEQRRRDVLAHDRDHIPRADVEAAVDKAVSEFRGQFEGLAGLLSAKIGGRPAADAHPVIQAEVHRVLAHLADGLRKAAAGLLAPQPEELDDDEPEDG